jgi:hypothetical protein
MSMTILCHELTSGKNESEIVSRLASAIGYFPVFAMFDSLTHVADSMVTAATGQKTGLSSSFEARVKQILDMAALVLAQIVDEQETAVESGKASRVRYPIVVIDAFMGNDRSMNLPAHQKLYDELAAWGAFLTQNGLAHVIFVSTGVGTYGHGASKVLTKGNLFCERGLRISALHSYSFAETCIRDCHLF